MIKEQFSDACVHAMPHNHNENIIENNKIYHVQPPKQDSYTHFISLSITN